MDVRLVEKRDVLGRAVIAPEGVDVVVLHAHGLLGRAVVRPDEILRQQARPLRVREGDAIQYLELSAEVCEQISLGVDREVLVRLASKQGDELVLEVGLGLIRGGSCGVRGELGYNGRLGRDCDRLVVERTRFAHAEASSKVRSLSR